MLVVSSDVIEECQRILSVKMPKVLPLFIAFVGLLPSPVEPMDAVILRVAAIVEAKDAPIVAAAMAAQAMYLATYDRKHLLTKKVEIGETCGITVATPDEIIAALDA